MLTIIVLTVVILTLLVDRHLTGMSIGAERVNRANERAALVAEHAAERRHLIDQAADERCELLTRLQHPELVVTRVQPQPEGAVITPVEDDDWGDVGVVMPLIEADDVPAEADPRGASA